MIIPSVEILRNISEAGSETLGKYPKGGGFRIYRQGSAEFFLGGEGGLNFEIHMFWLLVTAAVSFWVTKLVLYS